MALTLGKATTRKWTPEEKKKWETSFGKSDKPAVPKKEKPKPINLTPEKKETEKGFVSKLWDAATGKTISEANADQLELEGQEREEYIIKSMEGQKAMVLLSSVVGNPLRTPITSVQKAGVTGKIGGLAIKPMTAQELAIAKMGFATNTKTSSLTTKFLTIAGFSLAGAMLLKEIIGTYPFSGFIKEEAIQTMSFGVTTAMRANDWDLAQEAINLNSEILTKESTIVPWANVQQNLGSFFDAARLKNKIDQEVLNQMKTQEENGETEEEKWERIDREREERRAREKEEDERYYKNVEKERIKAKEEERKDDEKYWAKIQAEREKKEEEKRKADEKYWAAVRIENNKIYQSSKTYNIPSNLNFGLLQ